MQIDLLKELNQERTARRAVVQVTDLGSGESRIVREADISGDRLAEEIGRALRSGKSGLVVIDERETFLNVEVPPARVVIIGAVHISQALAPMVRLAGLDVEIVDPRTAFATPERFPGVTLRSQWPEDVLQAHPLDAYTALVAVTHDPKIDDVPLKAALDAGCFYVGALGSRKTHAKRLERIGLAGATEDQLARIEAPIGLDIGAASPAEIAVAVLGSVIRALRRRPLEAAGT